MSAAAASVVSLSWHQSHYPGARLVAHLAGYAESLAQQRGIELEIEVQLSAALPESIRSTLHHALTSVIDNAIQHGFGDDESGRISIRLVEAGPGAVSLVISDSGHGIDWDSIRARCIEQGLDARSPAALQAALFEPGVSSRLRMLNMLVLGVGGELSVASPPGAGCSVSITVPGF